MFYKYRVMRGMSQNRSLLSNCQEDSVRLRPSVSQSKGPQSGNMDNMKVTKELIMNENILAAETYIRTRMYTYVILCN